MSRLVLVTGGARSGKSRHALSIALAAARPRAFIATAVATDPEMEERIRRHREERARDGWETVEEPLALGAALGRPGAATVLVDCLAVWAGNLLFAEECGGERLTEDVMAALAAGLADAARAVPGRTVVLVTNEVGLGIVPDNALGRRYRDLLGRLNQVLAARADEVVLVCCGLPVVLKPGRP